MRDEMRLMLNAISENEYFARAAVAAFVVKMDPTMEELSDIKTAVSEAVTNAVVHGYEGGGGRICITGRIEDEWLFLEIADEGKGIENIERAREPLYTTKPDESHAGLGFTFMEAFMDELQVESEKNRGTKVSMRKRIVHMPVSRQKQVIM